MMNGMSIEMEVQHPAGLHLRPAAMFVQTAASGRLPHPGARDVINQRKNC